MEKGGESTELVKETTLRGETSSDRTPLAFQGPAEIKAPLTRPRGGCGPLGTALEKSDVNLPNFGSQSIMSETCKNTTAMACSGITEPGMWFPLRRIQKVQPPTKL